MKNLSHVRAAFVLFTPSRRVYEQTPDGQRSPLEASRLQDGAEPRKSDMTPDRRVDAVNKQSVKIEKGLKDMQTKAPLKGPFDDHLKAAGDFISGKVAKAKEVVSGYVKEKSDVAIRTAERLKGGAKDQAQSFAVGLAKGVKQGVAEVADNAARLKYDAEAALRNGKTTADVLQATYPPAVARKETVKRVRRVAAVKPKEGPGTRKVEGLVDADVKSEELAGRVRAERLAAQNELGLLKDAEIKARTKAERWQAPEAESLRNEPEFVELYEKARQMHNAAKKRVADMSAKIAALEAKEIALRGGSSGPSQVAGR